MKHKLQHSEAAPAGSLNTSEIESYIEDICSLNNQCPVSLEWWMDGLKKLVVSQNFDSEPIRPSHVKSTPSKKSSCCGSGLDSLNYGSMKPYLIIHGFLASISNQILEKGSRCKSWEVAGQLSYTKRETAVTVRTTVSFSLPAVQEIFSTVSFCRG